MIKSVFQGTNAQLIAYIQPLWIHPLGSLLDVTYGKGNWWKEYQPLYFTKHDLRLDGVDFRHLPEDDCSYQTVAFDPDYVSTGNKATSTVQDFYDAYGMGAIKGYQKLFERNAAGLTECARVVKYNGVVLCKVSDFVESGQLRLGFDAMLHAGEQAGLTLEDYIVHYSGTGPQPSVNRDGTPRRQVHSRRAHTFLQVFVKRNIKHGRSTGGVAQVPQQLSLLDDNAPALDTSGITGAS